MNIKNTTISLKVIKRMLITINLFLFLLYIVFLAGTTLANSNSQIYKEGINTTKSKITKIEKDFYETSLKITSEKAYNHGFIKNRNVHYLKTYKTHVAYAQ